MLTQSAVARLCLQCSKYRPRLAVVGASAFQEAEPVPRQDYRLPGDANELPG